MALFGGDDHVIKRCIGIIFVLFWWSIFLMVVFGIIQFFPGYKHRSAVKLCSYDYHTLIGSSFLRINAPVLPPGCKYGH